METLCPANTVYSFADVGKVSVSRFRSFEAPGSVHDSGSVLDDGRRQGRRFSCVEQVPSSVIVLQRFGLDGHEHIPFISLLDNCARL